MLTRHIKHSETKENQGMIKFLKKKKKKKKQEFLVKLDIWNVQMLTKFQTHFISQ